MTSSVPIPASPIPAAQYLRMSTEHQQYSLDFQQAKIQDYAQRNGFAVVATYIDAGKSGVVLKHREGLAQLLHDVLAGDRQFHTVLVYDVSRWGRFQDSDEAAHYEFLCKNTGVPVHYCAETFSNEITMPNTIMKSLKRIMAAEYSRELSDKMFACMTRMVGKGYWVGGKPGYGFRRMFVSADGSLRYVMEIGQHKELRNGHVLLVPGPPEEIACVREIFRMYTEGRLSTIKIANVLDERQVPRPGVPWSYRAVAKILFDEKYAGTMVWNRWTQKLTQHWVPVPRDRWITQPGAIEPIIDRKTFDKAQAIRAGFWWNKTDEELLDGLRLVLKSRGRLTATIINRARSIPSATSYAARFGSLPRVYEMLQYKRTDTLSLRQKTHTKVKQFHFDIYKRLRKLFPKDIVAIKERKSTRPRRLRFGSGLEVSLVVCLFDKSAKGWKRWRFQSTAARRSGLITLLARCNETNTGFQDFLVVPTVRHIAVISLLKQTDERLRYARKLRSLNSFRTVAHSMAKQWASSLPVHRKKPLARPKAA